MCNNLTRAIVLADLFWARLVLTYWSASQFTRRITQKCDIFDISETFSKISAFGPLRDSPSAYNTQPLQTCTPLCHFLVEILLFAALTHSAVNLDRDCVSAYTSCQPRTLLYIKSFLSSQSIRVSYYGHGVSDQLIPWIVLVIVMPRGYPIPYDAHWSCLLIWRWAAKVRVLLSTMKSLSRRVSCISVTSWNGCAISLHSSSYPTTPKEAL